MTEIGVSHLGFDDGVDEVQGEGMLFHAHRIEVVEGKFADPLNKDGKFPSKEEGFSLKVNTLFHSCGREDVVADTDVASKNTLKLSGLGGRAQDFVLLECL